nr:MAG TPA: hypothetical protein [Caudoviricetes sp.]
MGLADYLRTNNGLKTTQSVLNKQQSGVDAAQKATPEQINMNTAQAMLHGKEEQLTPPKDAHEQAVRMNQQTAEGMLNGSIPIVKKEEPKPETKLEPEKKQLTYAEMYRMLNPSDSESPEQRAQREKNEKRKARIAAFGDGLRALANIVFASKGAKVVHNPESDMTAAINKRKAYMDAQREKNRAAWQAGYQRALALDEEARKNNLTLAEQMRYHDIIAKNNDSKNDLSQQRIDQGNRRLDLSKMKYDTDADYKKSILAIKKALADGQISHWQAQEAIQRMNAETGRIRANKSGSGGSRKGSYSGEVDEYMDLMEKDPEGMAEAAREVRRMGYSPKTAAGKKAQKIAYQRKHGKPKQHHTSSSNNGGKKKTGVNW